MRGWRLGLRTKNHSLLTAHRVIRFFIIKIRSRMRTHTVLRCLDGLLRVYYILHCPHVFRHVSYLLQFLRDVLRHLFFLSVCMSWSSAISS